VGRLEQATVRIEPETLNLNSKGTIAGNTLSVKFDRQSLVGIPAGNEVTLTVRGSLSSGGTFEGSDTIRVIDKGKK